MFDRFRKRKEPEGRTCPLCELVNSSQCYFQFEKNTRQQDEAISNEEEGTLLDELLNSEVEIDEDETTPVDVITMEQMTVEIDQYEVVENVEAVEDFTFIKSSGPTFAEIEAEGDGPIESQITPALTSMPGMEVEQNLDFESEVADEIEIDESEHDVDLLSLPELPQIEAPPPIERDDADFPHAPIPESEEEITPLESPETIQSEEPIDEEEALPFLPDPIVEEATLPDSEVSIESESETVEVPLPEIPQTPTYVPTTAPSADVFITRDNGHVWPWPSEDEWDYRDLYRELKEAMEAGQRGDHSSAAKSLDYLGPHLGSRIDLIYYVGQVMQILGRHESLFKMLSSAQIKYPEDQNVSSAVYHLAVTGSDHAGNT